MRANSKAPMPPDELSPRLEEFRRSIANCIPCNPNTSEGRSELLAMSLSDLVIRYLNWMQRFVPPRPRAVYFDRTFWSSGALSLEKEIYDLADRCRRGENIANFLSSKIKADGYIPKGSTEKKRRGVEWGDKDFALNAFNTHHIHLTQRGGKELAYVEFVREAAYFIFLGDHKSFDNGSLEQAVVSARAASNRLVLNIIGMEKNFTAQERTKLARHGISTFAMADGKAVVSSMVSSAGTSTRQMHLAQQTMRKLRDMDEKLDDLKLLLDLEAQTGLKITDPCWTFGYCELSLFQRGGNELMGIVQAPF